MNAFILAHLMHLRAAGRSPRTVDDRRKLLFRIDGQLPHGLVAAAAAELEEWLARPGWSRWTLCTYHMHLRGFFAWAAGGSRPMLDWNPMAELGRPSAPRNVPNPVSGAELEHALARSNQWWRLVIMLAAYAGLRVSEIARQRREDVDQVRLVVRGKGDVTAAVPTHPLLWTAVEALPAGPLVRRPHGGLVTGNWLTERARGHFDRLGLPAVHLHRFRHWFGTTLQERYGDLRLTQELMRHASPATTAGYAQVTDARRRAAVAGLPVLGEQLQDAEAEGAEAQHGGEGGQGPPGLLEGT